ncbi:hypothetical protein [Vibrio phage VP4B]|uniref:Uncharacterized protein n=1 Tax=Vibrio phage VP4B TaxID=1262540 RepID=V9M0A0_9CAUD|nr:hypothetical protein FDJ61_gp137 [Vibrio phage VP4B]AGB07251.1 hypothetical protein [Vibrio phage VP4B]
MIKYYLGVYIKWFYRCVYKLDPDQEVFKGYLKHYLGMMGISESHLLIHNERVVRQLEFLNMHNYKCDFNGAVFIAGCIYAERVLGYRMHHQCLSFGNALSDVFRHRHQFTTTSIHEVVTQSLERVCLTETHKLSKDLTNAVKSIIS